MPVKIVIQKYSGAVRRLKMFCLGGLQQEYVSPSGSVFGQAALPEAIAVGAIDIADPGLGDVEFFSSRGPTTIGFPAPETRPKPDLAAFDGVSITNAGGFPLCPPACRFFGTSAAAPHSAAVAALLLGKNPFLSPATVRNVLREAATDIGPAGPDDVSGFGRLDALAAAEAVPTPECRTDRDCDDGDACTTDACDRGACAHSPVLCSAASRELCTESVCDRTQGCLTPPLGGLVGVACWRSRPPPRSTPRRAFATGWFGSSPVRTRPCAMPSRRRRLASCAGSAHDSGPPAGVWRPSLTPPAPRSAAPVWRSASRISCRADSAELARSSGSYHVRDRTRRI